MQRPARVPPGGLAGLGHPVHPAPAAHDPLHVGGGARSAHRQQPRFRLGSGHPGQRPHLRVRQLPAGERLRQERQRAERVRHPHALPGRARVEPDAPGEPGGAGAEARVPAAAGVELADQGEQARGGGVEMRRQLGDLVTKSIQLRSGLQRSGNVGRAKFHEFHVRASPYLLGRLYTRVFATPWSLQDGRSRREP